MRRSTCHDVEVTESELARYVAGEIPSDRGYYVPLGDPGFHREQTLEELGDGLFAWLPAMFVARDVDGVDVTMVLDMVDEGIRPIEVRVSSRDTAMPVTGETLRRVRVAELFKIAVGAIINYDPERVEGTTRTRLTPIAVDVAIRIFDAPEPPNALPERPESREALLQRVATMYRAASVAGIPPQKFVLESFQVPRSTAGYWIAQARARGYLAPARRDGSPE